ncbi:DUF4030 domain-containing protein [Bacillus sp. IBL03825]|uniref:DUF4030 domain-containing protein n=1 Tax=Bacillus sp. IBL03825 TaxID=2953580 RepID=UPI0021579B71|nr:DUF4030 domain-containing protein [Bacillus sp. IBL03825]MCR6850432.1 DUF4030 domain-containing protein [Bacillus sp. IBL03825]
MKNNSDPVAKESGQKIEKEIDNLLKTTIVNKLVNNKSYAIEIYHFPTESTFRELPAT